MNRSDSWDDGMWNMKRKVREMHDVSHRGGLPYWGNGYWELDEQKNKEKRSLDDLDVDKLEEMHDSKRARYKFERTNRENTAAMYQSGLDKHLKLLGKQFDDKKEWNLYRLTQRVNIGYEICYEALVVAPSEQEAKFISPWNDKPG